MSAQVANLRPGGAADLFRLRAANFSLLVLRLLDARVEAVVPAIADQFRRAPGFLRNAPIAIGLDDLEDGAQVDFETLIRELRAAAIPHPAGTSVTVSIGGATLCGAEAAAPDLFRLADAALYEAKRAGRDTFRHRGLKLLERA